jgi:hypothetical protein
MGRQRTACGRASLALTELKIWSSSDTHNAAISGGRLQNGSPLLHVYIAPSCTRLRSTYVPILDGNIRRNAGSIPGQAAIVSD